MSKFRILALDGGGSWALLQVMALMDLYGDVNGHQILKKFDLAAANSGGALTLSGLIMDWKLSDLLHMFLDADKRGQIFVKAGFFDDPIAHLTQLADFGPKYRTVAKYQGLRNLMGAGADAPVTSVPGTVGAGVSGRVPHVVFCGFDYDINRETFFRSDVGSLTQSQPSGNLGPVTIAQAVHASANPPVNYFDAPAAFGGRRYWDGAVGGYNNPVLAGVIEALGNAERYQTARADICALSIGTGNVALPRPLHLHDEDPDLVAQLQGSAIVPDVKKMASSILDDPPDAASFHAHVMLDGALPQAGTALPVNGPLVRLNPLIQPWLDAAGRWDYPAGLPKTGAKDDPTFTAMRDMPMDATEPDQVTAIRKFGTAWLKDQTTNQPIRANSSTLKAEIGFDRYSVARNAALAMFP